MSKGKVDRLLNKDEICERLGCSQRTLARHVVNDVGPPSFRVGGKRYWRERDYLTWLDKSARQKGGISPG